MTDTTVQAEPGLAGIVSDLMGLIQGKDAVSLKVLLDTICARGHGPILLTLAALMLLPTGMLPMMQVVIGALLLLTALQMLVGGKGVSLPRWISRREIGTQVLKSALTRAAPVAQRLSRFTCPRAHWWVHSHPALTGVALVLMGFAAVTILVGAIPGLPFVLCIPALLFGLGLTSGDGVVVAAGFFFGLLPAWFTLTVLPKVADWLF